MNITILNKLLTFYPDLPRPVIININNSLETELKNDDVSVLSILDNSFNTETIEIIQNKIYNIILNNIDDNYNDNNRKRISIMNKYRSSIPNKINIQIMDKLVNIISSTPNNLLTTEAQYAINYLTNYTNLYYDKNWIEQYYNFILNRYNTCDPIEGKWEYIKLYIDFFSLFTDARKNNIMNDTIQNFVQISDEKHFDLLISKIQECKIDIFSYNQARNHLITRAQNNFWREKNIVFILNNYSNAYAQEISNFIISALNRDSNIFEIFTSAITNNLNDINTNKLNYISTIIIGDSKNKSPEIRHRNYSILTNIYEYLNESEQITIMHNVNELINDDNDTILNYGINLYNEIKTYLNRRKSITTFRNMISYMQSKRELNASDRTRLDFIISNFDVLYKKDISNLMDVLISQLSVAKETISQDISLDYIKRISALRELDEDVIENVADLNKASKNDEIKQKTEAFLFSIRDEKTKK